MMITIGEIRYQEVENCIKVILLKSDKNIGVHINTHDFFVVPIQEEGFNYDEIIYTIRGLIGKGYFVSWNEKSDDSSTVKLTQRGRDGWLLVNSDPEEILKLSPEIYGMGINLKSLWKIIKKRFAKK